jgi:hypothetical protein
MLYSFPSFGFGKCGFNISHHAHVIEHAVIAHVVREFLEEIQNTFFSGHGNPALSSSDWVLEFSASTQEFGENLVVIVNATLLHVLKPFGNRFQQAQTVDGVVDGGILRHSLDDVNDFLFRR